MINFEINPALLTPYLPKYTELDLFEGKALISMVGFMFKQVKVFGLKWPFHVNFEEVNLRFYVRHFDGKNYRRGVVFISEIVPRFIIASLANILYNEQYSAMPMRHSIQVKNESRSVEYAWKHKKKWNSLQVQVDKKVNEIKQGSEEEFIFEHYWGYSKYNATTTIEYGVEHEKWQVYQVNDWSINCEVASLYGETFVPTLAQKPSSVFMAKGSNVLIRKPRFIKSAG